MKITKYISFSALALAAMLNCQPADAQVKLADDAYPVIVAPHKQTVSYRERTLCYDITANVDFTATTDTEWITVRKADDGTVYIHLDMNDNVQSRVGTVVFGNAEKGLSETLTITQTRYEGARDMTQDVQVKVSSATDNTHQDAGSDASKSIDGDLSTIYHSKWSDKIGEDNPAILTYNFKDVELIDYVNYVTRQTGGSNGNFGKVEIYTKCEGDADFVLNQTVDFGFNGGTHRVDFSGGLKNPVAVQFKVLTGYTDGGGGPYASCAEMQFFVDMQKDLFGIFADDALTQLRDGVTQADINNIDDEYVAHLAQKLYDKTYDMNYRVATYKCRTSPQAFSEEMNAPGKLYDQNQGVTGINIRKGKQAVAVSGLPEGTSVPMHVIAWYEGKCSGNFDGGNPQQFSYTLRNGFNLIDYPFAYDGLAYICYYADVNPELQPDIKVHFIDGEVNGYLSLDHTNDEMHEMCAKAPNMCIDVVGNAVHSIWTTRGVRDDFPTVPSKGLYGNCLAIDGSLGYRQFIHVMDSIAIWEHDILGLGKYNRRPDNRTGAYVNFTYYMFQGGLGVSFHVDQEPRVLNCKTLVMNDEDVIWGLSHEWGHQHQMLPYFCWSGLGEVSNNMNSYYNIMRMGYSNNRMTGSNDGTAKPNSQYANARRIFVDHDYSTVCADYKGNTPSLKSHMRHLAYTNASELQSKSLRDFALTMKDSTITQYKTNPAKAVSIHEVGVGETLCPFLFVYDYFVQNGVPDIAKDWYESLRQNDFENGSQVEKQGGADKYELLASAMNNNKNGKYTQFKNEYPTSCWITNEYLIEGNNWYQNSAPFMMNWVRKVSRITGYNLLPYFERWGFFRQIAMRIGDYGNKWMIITPEMYEEFKADMQALVDNGEIKSMPEGMVEDISNVPTVIQPRPQFPN
ncbi:MAG: M60 family metallopeptidase [Alloprevotella sp.]